MQLAHCTSVYRGNAMCYSFGISSSEPSVQLPKSTAANPRSLRKEFWPLLKVSIEQRTNLAPAESNLSGNWIESYFIKETLNK